MLLKDYFIFVFSLLYAERHRVKRLFLIIILGSFLSFFIFYMSSSIKYKINLDYQDRHILLPYMKGTQQVLEFLDYDLLDYESKSNLVQEFDDLSFIEEENEQEIMLFNLTSNESVSLSYELNSFDNSNYINTILLNIYSWGLEDLYKIDATVIEFKDTHETDIDLILNPNLIQTITKLTSSNILNIRTSHDINKVLEWINHSLLNTGYEYRIEPFGANDLFNTLISLVERVLLTFSFLIFIVSSSNIGTIMPYFVNEFKDEMNTLRYLGLSKNIIFKIFLLTSILILLASLLISNILAYIISIIISIFIRSKVYVSGIKTLILFSTQTGLGMLFSLQSIKKASDDITYL